MGIVTSVNVETGYAQLERATDKGYLDPKLRAASVVPKLIIRTLRGKSTDVNMKQLAVALMIWLDEKNHDYLWYYKAEVTFNVPLSGTPVPVLTANSKDKNRRHSHNPFGQVIPGAQRRRPDIIIVKDKNIRWPGRAATYPTGEAYMDNLSRVVEVKFEGDQLSKDQDRDYPEAVIQADGTRESYLHDAEGRLLEHTDPLKQNTRYAEELSKLIGYYTYKARSTSRSRGKSSSGSISDQKRAVMNPDELKVMSDTDCIISMAGMQPIYAEKILYYKDPALKGRANLPPPHVPELKVHLAAKPPAAALKPEYVPPEVLEDFNWRDAANAEELARSVLEAILPAGSPPEFVAQMVPAIARNWGEGSLSVIASILKETSGITVDTKEMRKEAA